MNGSAPGIRPLFHRLTDVGMDYVREHMCTTTITFEELKEIAREW